MKLSRYLSGSLALLLLAACATPTVQTQQWSAQTAGGDFSAEGENILIVGNPAKVVGKGYSMGSGWYPEAEAQIAQQMEQMP